jgi:DNA end-binding protein Ku
MASRSVWKGFISFSLVSIPVKAFTAAVTGGGDIRLNQLHATCHSRIKYEKTCPIHGKVPNEEIVSGYQFAEDKYVIIEPDELDKIRTPREKSIDIDAFIAPDQIDEVYFSGKSYYLAPDSPAANKSYTLLVKLLAESGRYAFAKVAMHGKEHLVILRPRGDVLTMQTLNFASDMKSMAEFEGEVPKVEVTAAELKLARQLLETLAVEKFDLGEYKDHTTEAMQKLIEMKVAGQDIVSTPDEEAPKVINLMEALQQSIRDAKDHAKATGRAKPAKIVADRPARTPKHATATARRRKIS